MKITFVENRYFSITLQDEFFVLESRANQEVTQEDVLANFKLFTKELMKLYLNGDIQGKSLKVLIDTSKETYIMMPETQEFIDAHYFPQLILLSERIAILPSRDITSQVATELLMDEDNSKNFHTKYFESKKDAINWLNASQV